MDEGSRGHSMSKENVKSGQQGTDKPWERPGQSSQDRSIKPPTKQDREDNLPPSAIKRVERPTEDDLAQAALGGPKGSPDLPAAPLTKTEREQNLPNDEPGHVA
jgi:hypothetical protein